MFNVTVHVLIYQYSGERFSRIKIQDTLFPYHVKERKRKSVWNAVIDKSWRIEKKEKEMKMLDFRARNALVNIFPRDFLFPFLLLFWYQIHSLNMNNESFLLETKRLFVYFIFFFFSLQSTTHTCFCKLSGNASQWRHSRQHRAWLCFC